MNAEHSLAVPLALAAQERRWVEFTLSADQISRIDALADAYSTSVATGAFKIER